MVQALIKLQALYNVDMINITKKATRENGAIKNLNFLTDSAMVTKDSKPVSEESKTFSKAWNHPNANSIFQHEQATGMVRDMQKSYPSHSKVCKKQITLQDQMQQFIPGMSCFMQEQSGTWHWSF